MVMREVGMEDDEEKQQQERKHKGKLLSRLRRSLGGDESLGQR